MYNARQLQRLRKTNHSQQLKQPPSVNKTKLTYNEPLIINLLQKSDKIDSENMATWCQKSFKIKSLHNYMIHTSVLVIQII